MDEEQVEGEDHETYEDTEDVNSYSQQITDLEKQYKDLISRYTGEMSSPTSNI